MSKNAKSEKSPSSAILWLGVPVGAVIIWGLYDAFYKPSRRKTAESALAASEQKRLMAEKKFAAALATSEQRLARSLERQAEVEEQLKATYKELSQETRLLHQFAHDKSKEIEGLKKLVRECDFAYLRDTGQNREYRKRSETKQVKRSGLRFTGTSS